MMGTREIDYINGIRISIDIRSAIYHEWCGSFNAEGEFAIDEVNAIYETLKNIENPVLVDIGANTGSHSLVGLAIPNLVCFAFEPIPLFYEVLKNNIRLNGLTNRVYAFNFALSNRPEFLNLSLHLGTAYVDNAGSIQALAVPLDIFGFEKVDYIKVDTDGHDHYVLEGAKETLKKCHPKVCYEGYQDNGMCKKFLEEIGM